MRRLMILIFLCVFFVSACSNALDSSTKTDDVLEITEKLFIAQCNDINMNPDDYVGKKVKIAGVYNAISEGKKTYHFVERYGPGCCSNDGTVGLEFVYNGKMPKPKDWIELTGVIDIVREDRFEYVAVRVSELTYPALRGNERVTN